MPKWIHTRAEHLLAKNPKMRKSTAFAVATQQSKTAEVREADGPMVPKEERAEAQKARELRKEADGISASELQEAKDKMAAAIRTPESQLAKTQNIGIPKYKPPSKGIGQIGKISKPKGLSNTLPGLGNNS